MRIVSHSEVKMLFGLIGNKKRKDTKLEDKIEDQKDEDEESAEKTIEKTGLENISIDEIFERYHKNFRGPVHTTEANRFNIKKIEYELGQRILAMFPKGSLVICEEYDDDRNLRQYPGKVNYHCDSSDMSGLFSGDYRFSKRISSSTFEYIKKPFKTGEHYSTTGDESIFKRIRPASKEEVIALLRDMSKDYKPNLESTDLSEAMKAREYAFFRLNIDKIRRWNAEESYFNMYPEFSKTHYVVGMMAERAEDATEWRDMILRPVMTDTESCEDKVNGLISNLLKDKDFCKDFNPPRDKNGHFYMYVFGVPKEAHGIIEANNPFIPYAGYKMMK